MDFNDSPRYSDESVQRILKRAMELEQSRSESISERDLHQIARELGIRPSSLELALRESATASESVGHQPLAPDEMAPSWKVPLLVMGGGVLTAMISRGAWSFLPVGFGAVSSVAAMMFLQSAAVAVSTLYRGAARHERFQMANLLMWGGFAAGWTFLHGSGPGYFWGTVASFVATAAVSGSAVIWIRDRLRTMKETAKGETGASTGSTSTRALLTANVQEAAAAWVRRLLRLPRFMGEPASAAIPGGKSNSV